jgi:hypothetical protein
MTDSPNTTLLSRRALMSVSVGLVGANVAAAAIAVRAAKAMAPAAPGDTADAELVDMCRQWVRLCRAHDHVSDRAMDIEGVDKQHYDVLNSIADRIHDSKMEPLAKAIAACPAASWAGVSAKASVLASDQSFVSTGETNDIFFCLEPLVLSMVKDAVRLGAMHMPQCSSLRSEA